MALGLKKNDTVVVLAGKDKGKKGRVLNVDRDTAKVIVEKVNVIKKHMKPSRTHQQGGIIERESTLDRSNVMLVCPKCSKPTRIATAVYAGDKKSRTCKKCKEVIDT